MAQGESLVFKLFYTFPPAHSVFDMADHPDKFSGIVLANMNSALKAMATFASQHGKITTNGESLPRQPFLHQKRALLSGGPKV